MYIGNKMQFYGQIRLRCEECREMGLGKRQEPDDAKDNTKELGLAS